MKLISIGFGSTVCAERVLAVIAVTGSDELNLLCCTIAKKAGGALAAIARVRNPDYSEELPYLRQQLGLSMIINPELEAAQEIARLLSRPQALTVSSFAKGHAELVRFKGEHFARAAHHAAGGYFPLRLSGLRGGKRGTRGDSQRLYDAA